VLQNKKTFQLPNTKLIFAGAHFLPAAIHREAARALSADQDAQRVFIAFGPIVE
jgi:hypothetical protein